MKRRILASSLATAACSVLLAATPNEASACGGTFCDNGPTAMPVDQTGEVILFVMDQDFTEAHILIQYDPTTTAEKFAWVVPVQTVPTFTVGSQPLFDAMLNSTVPSYGFTQQFEDCGDMGGDGGGDGGDDGGEGGDPDDGGGGPDVVLEETVGAFDVVVLQGGTAMEVMDWLNMNGYQQDPNAEPILEEYLAENYLFAAFKLTNGADVEEIHPVTLRFDNINEACVPIRLTRIAAAENMGIRSFFLAANRVVPRNYRHVLVNPLKLDWPNQASNYSEAITMAVDADNADGKAFVTEYAGPSDIVPSGGLFSPAWDATMFEGIDPVLIIDELMAQGILYCEPGYCEYYHPLLRGLLLQWLPRPAGVDEQEFYGCLSCYEGQIDLMAWNDAEFSTAYADRIIEPGRYAAQMLTDWPYLSRMFTTISPAEMTEDPFFHENPDLNDVTNIQQIAAQTIQCEGDSVWTLPDGREVYVPAGAGWPAFDDEMPWEEEVSLVPPTGAPMVLTDNTELIGTELDEYNCQYNWPSASACGNPDDGAGDDGGTGDDGGDATGDGASSERGCSCTAAGPVTPMVAFGGLMLLGLARRRRS